MAKKSMIVKQQKPQKFKSTYLNLTLKNKNLNHSIVA